MEIAIIGAAGRVGTRLIDEALRRGHQVAATARIASKLPAYVGLTTKDVDVAGETGLVATLAGNDVIYNTVRFLQASINQIVDAVKKTAMSRLLVTGDADSLEVAPDVALIDTLQFLKGYFEEASVSRDFLNALRKKTELNWAFVSPSAISEPGERMGRLRVGRDSLLMDVNGKPWISMEDYAIAFLGETKKSARPHRRLTVGY